MINVQIKDYWSTNAEWFVNLDWKKFQEVWPLATAEEKPKNLYECYGPCRITMAEAQVIATMGVPLEIVPLPGTMVTKMQDNPRQSWEYSERPSPADLADGRAVMIAVPDMELMYIDEVAVETDCCTDALQGLLNEGWRILAVCPPNAQRRPDYVIGRRKTPKDPFDGR